MKLLMYTMEENKKFKKNSRTFQAIQGIQV